MVEQKNSRRINGGLAQFFPPPLAGGGRGRAHHPLSPRSLRWKIGGRALHRKGISWTCGKPFAVRPSWVKHSARPFRPDGQPRTPHPAPRSTCHVPRATHHAPRTTRHDFLFPLFFARLFSTCMSAGEKMSARQNRLRCANWTLNLDCSPLRAQRTQRSNQWKQQ